MNMSNLQPNHCFLKLSIAGEVHPEPIVIELDHQNCPITCESFATLCSSPDTTSASKPCPSYRGCEFHRIIPNFMVQAGDFEKFNGTGGYSPLTSGPCLPDEYLKGVHDKPGIVSMANKGRPRTGGSQFFITLQATPHLDGKHVVFGKVVQGMEVLQSMIHVEREEDRPVSMQKVRIVDCGTGTGPTGKKRKKSEKKRKKRKHRSKRTKGRNSTDSSSADSIQSSSRSSSTSSYKRRRKSKRAHKSRKKEARKKRRKY